MAQESGWYRVKYAKKSKWEIGTYDIEGGGFYLAGYVGIFPVTNFYEIDWRPIDPTLPPLIASQGDGAIIIS